MTFNVVSVPSVSVGLGSEESQRNGIFGAKNGARAKKFSPFFAREKHRKPRSSDSSLLPNPTETHAAQATFDEATSGEVVQHFLIDSEDFERLDICLQKELSLFNYSISNQKVLEQN